MAWKGAKEGITPRFLSYDEFERNLPFGLGLDDYFLALRISAILTGLPPRLADKSAAKINS
jgi:hypothetical protein